MKILVTGGAGFIGSHIVDAYIKLGHEVITLDDLSRGSTSNLNPLARFYPIDIQDRDAVDNLFANEKPEIVNHHAAQIDVRRSVKEPQFDARVNILGSLNLLEAAVSHGARRIIYVSTAGAVYGEPKHLPVTEEHPINPIAPYGITKHTVEHFLFMFSQVHGLSYVVLRYGNVYGPRQSSKGEASVFAIFSEQMLAGIQPVIYGDGTKTRDYVYIDDVVRANVAALDAGTGEIVNIGSGIATSDEEVFRLIRGLLGKNEVQQKHVDPRPGEVDKIYLNISKAQRVLQWEPSVSLLEGGSRTVAFFRQRAQTEAVIHESSNYSPTLQLD